MIVYSPFHNDSNKEVHHPVIIDDFSINFRIIELVNLKLMKKIINNGWFLVTYHYEKCIIGTLISFINRLFWSKKYI